MIELNLYPGLDSSETRRRIAANIKPGLTDLEFLEKEIARWLSSDERKKQLEGEAYYSGDQDILKRRRMAVGDDGEMHEIKYLPNNRIVNNQYAKMVDQKANYLLGKPVTFDTENTAYGEALSRIFNKKMQRTLRVLAEKALIGGRAWLFPYYDNNGDFAFSVLSAEEVLPFWADTAHTILDCAVHFFPVYEYDAHGKENVINKVEIFDAAGVKRYIWQNGHLVYDNDAASGPYATTTDKDGKEMPLNWQKIPLVCFKANHREKTLLSRVKCLQDALNLLMSDFVNNMNEDVHSTVLVIKNYDGENLGEFRRNLALYGAIKIRNLDGADGSVETLKIEINAANYQLVLSELKKAIIENARGFDAKDERLSGTPNELNIRSMYSDIDLDANAMETEFQAAIEDMLFFVNAYLANSGAGNFDGIEVTAIFNRDILVNESEAIDNCAKSQGIISKETVVRQHPWVDDPEEELRRIKDEEEQAAAEADAYRAAFESTAGGDAENTEAPDVKDGADVEKR